MGARRSILVGFASERHRTVLELLEHDLHFLRGEERRLADLQRPPVHLGERLDLDGERQRGLERSRRRQSCHGARAGRPFARRARAAPASASSAVPNVAYEAQRMSCPAGDGDHVVERRDAAVEAGERGGERRMRVDDRLHLGPRRVDRAVEAPFRRGHARAGERCRRRAPSRCPRDRVSS